MLKLYKGVTRSLARCFITKVPFTRRHASSVSNVLRYEKDGTMSGQKSNRVLHVVGCHENATKGVILTADQNVYFINCPEGTQRALHAMRLSKSKEVNMLITRNVWSNMGGLIGSCIHFQEAQKSSVRCHGSPSLKQLFSNARGFSQFNQQPTVIVRSKKEFVDDFVKITYLPLMKSAPVTGDSNRKSPASMYEDEVTSYVFEPVALARRIDMEKCVQLGVKRGPLVGQLKKGESVTLDDGSVVNPEQVLREPEAVDSPLLVVDCPSVHYLDSMNSAEGFQSLFTEDDVAKVSLVVHLTSADVMLDDAYIQWMKRFGPHARHLAVNDLGQSSPVPDILWMQAQLNLFDANIFPLLREPFMKTEEEVENNLSLFTPHDLNVTLGKSNLKYRWSYNQDFDWDQAVTSSDATAVQQESLQDEDFEKMLQEFKPKVEKLRENVGREFPRLTFLGTGSASPSKYRNISGILLQAKADQYFILDCGESSHLQMLFHYGEDELTDILIHLDMIYISHLHPDHHLGFFTILLERQKAFAVKNLPYKPLKVIACQSFENWYRLVETHFGVPVSQLIQHFFVENFQVNFFSRVDENLLEDLNMQQIRSVHVHHTQFPFGICLKHVDGWSLVYSGDTMPCEALVKEGQDCDVLIHEATFMQGMENDAALKNHSTISQALKVGNDMKAKFTILTHFSQRFHKIPLMPPEDIDNAGSATDHMRISVGDLGILPLLKPLFEQLFKEEHNMVKRRMSFWIEKNANEPPKKKYKINERQKNYKRFSPPSDPQSSSPNPKERSPQRYSRQVPRTSSPTMEWETSPKRKQKKS